MSLEHYILGKAVKLLLKAVLLNTRENFILNINQKELFVQVNFGLNRLVLMEPEMFVPIIIIGHVAITS